MKRNRNPQGSKEDRNHIYSGEQKQKGQVTKALLCGINQLQIYFRHLITPNSGSGTECDRGPARVMCPRLGRGEEGSLTEHRPVGLQQGKRRPPQENQSAGLAK